MAVGVQFIRQRARQRVPRDREQPLHLRQVAREVLAQFVEEIRITLRNLRGEQLRRHAEGARYLGRAQQGGERGEGVGDVLVGQRCDRADAFAHRMHGRAEQVGDALADARRHRHDGHGEACAQFLRVDVDAALARFVHLVERDHQRPSELGQLQREFQVMFERGGVDHLHDDVRRRERRRRTVRLVLRDGRAFVAPQQILERRAVVRLQVVRGADARQVDHARLVQPDLHGAFVVGAARPGERAGLHGRAGDGGEYRALAAVGQPHQRDAQPPRAAVQRQGHGNPRDMGGRLLHLGIGAVGPAPVYFSVRAFPRAGRWAGSVRRNREVAHAVDERIQRRAPVFSRHAGQLPQRREIEQDDGSALDLQHALSLQARQ